LMAWFSSHQGDLEGRLVVSWRHGELGGWES
jgi:hypothetical protein